jgi:hypothetical protein
MIIKINRFFASLRFALNDNYLGYQGEWAACGSATSSPLTLLNNVTYCHSERSEESIKIPRMSI